MGARQPEDRPTRLKTLPSHSPFQAVNIIGTYFQVPFHQIAGDRVGVYR